MPMKKAIIPLSFLSMAMAWSLVNIYHTLYDVTVYGKEDESGVMIFWSGFFICLAWAIFIVFPLKKLNHSTKLFKPFIFIPVCVIYGALTYVIFIGGIFRDVELVFKFLYLAALTGGLFGLIYIILIKNEKVVMVLSTKFIARLLCFLSPVIILGFFLWLLPNIFPSYVFRFMPDAIKNDIVIKTIPKYKVGDNFTDLEDALPGYFEGGLGYNHEGSEFMPGFEFEFQVKDGKITKLDYSKR
jgi:hypothetical protein